jgi:hypothetical protein
MLSLSKWRRGVPATVEERDRRPAEGEGKMPQARGNAPTQSYATRMVQGGVDLHKVQRLLAGY